MNSSSNSRHVLFENQNTNSCLLTKFKRNTLAQKEVKRKD